MTAYAQAMKYFSGIKLNPLRIRRVLRVAGLVMTLTAALKLLVIRYVFHGVMAADASDSSHSFVREAGIRVQLSLVFFVVEQDKSAQPHRVHRYLDPAHSRLLQ